MPITPQAMEKGGETVRERQPSQIIIEETNTMDDMTGIPTTPKTQGDIRRQPREYRIVNWGEIPKNLVDAVQVGDYPPRTPALLEEHIVSWLYRIFAHGKSNEKKVNAAISVTTWPSEPTAPQRRIMELLVEAEDATDSIYDGLGSPLEVVREYPEVDLRRDCNEIGVAAYRLLSQGGNGNGTHHTQSTIDSVEELARRVNAITRFSAAVRESRRAAA